MYDLGGEDEHEGADQHDEGHAHEKDRIQLNEKLMSESQARMGCRKKKSRT